MHAFKISAVVLAIAAAGAFATADDKHADHKQAGNAEFEKFKALNGDWDVKPVGTDHGPMSGTVSYKVTAGGSAVMETLFAGTDHEMVTLYYVDGEGLAMTHYCVLGNRPLMRAQAGKSESTIVFKCNDRDNEAIKSEEHMHQASFTFVDPNHMKSEWVLYKEGKADSTHRFELTRKKK